MGLQCLIKTHLQLHPAYSFLTNLWFSTDIVAMSVHTELQSSMSIDLEQKIPESCLSLWSAMTHITCKMQTQTKLLTAFFKNGVYDVYGRSHDLRQWEQREIHNYKCFMSHELDMTILSLASCACSFPCLPGSTRNGQ